MTPAPIESSASASIMPRNRADHNADLPPNLYTRRTGDRIYYVFRDPETGDTTRLGRDRSAAIRSALKANEYFARQGDTRANVPSMDELLAEYTPARLEGLNSEHTRKNTANYLKQIGTRFGRSPISDISSLQISDYLDEFPLTYRHRIRQELVRLFKRALARGYLPHNYGNPAAVTETSKAPKPERLRLAYPDYQRIHEVAPSYLQRFMDLMLQTTLRPGDMVNLLKIQYDGQALETQISKNRRYLRIELGPAAIAMVEDCLATGIDSPYILHKAPQRFRIKHSSRKQHPSQLLPDEVSKEFSALRDGLGIGADLPARQRPSLYEIRSLASWMYQQAGRPREEVQQLMAHTNEQMTAIYQEDRRIQYTAVRADLNLLHFKPQ